MRSQAYLIVLGLVILPLVGCGPKDSASQLAGDNMPTFSLAWSEYPSWSVFGVADELGTDRRRVRKVGHHRSGTQGRYRAPRGQL